MPLPAYLLERLKRRKIIQEVPKEEEDEDESTTPAREDQVVEPAEGANSDQEQEEILAEDYSDGDHANKEEADDISTKSADAEEEDSGSDSEVEPTTDCDNPQDRDESVLGCPNKYNIYHICSQYCADTYRDVDPNPTLEQRKQLALILRTFPMTNEWSVVYDPGLKTFYFWNIITNHVSWLPPGMNGFVSMSADQARRTLREANQISNNEGSMVN